MRPGRLSGYFGPTAALASLVLVATDCRDATEIVIDVRTNLCDRVRDTTIAVAAPGELGSARPVAFSPPEPCVQADRIGTLTVVPRDAKDAEIAVRIVTGVDKSAAECDADPSGCIIARRRARFIAGRSQRLLVHMAAACLGKDCGPELECAPSGACVDPAEILDDGGTGEPPPEDAGAGDGAVAEGGGADACAACTGAHRTCSDGLCEIRCEETGACSGQLCAPGLACDVTCTVNGACPSIACGDGTACRVRCTQGGACGAVACTTTTCDVECSGANSCSSVVVDAGDAGIACSGNAACGPVACHGGKCRLQCNANACPATNTCTATLCEGPWD
jgi:hypothetical protein